MGNRKVAIPCLTDPVNKLVGCGVQICKNLADIDEYAGHGIVLPSDFIKRVTTGQLTQCLSSPGANAEVCHPPQIIHMWKTSGLIAVAESCLLIPVT